MRLYCARLFPSRGLSRLPATHGRPLSLSAGGTHGALRASAQLYGPELPRRRCLSHLATSRLDSFVHRHGARRRRSPCCASRPFKPLRVFGDFYVQVFRNIPGMRSLHPHRGVRTAARSSSCLTLRAPASSSATVLLGCVLRVRELHDAASTPSASARSRPRARIGLLLHAVSCANVVIPQALRSTVLPMTNLFIAVMLTTALGCSGAA